MALSGSSSPSPLSPVSLWHEATDDSPSTAAPTKADYRPRRSSYNWPDTPTKTMLPLLLLNDADTLVFIDPAPENRSTLTPTIPHRVHSEKLLATGSTYFQRLFSPRCQNLVRKRRGFATSLPPGVKYVIDLTPPTTDEDAILVLTEVSCPMAIRTWASCQDKWNLPPSCVGGEDEREVLPDISESPSSHMDTNSAYAIDMTLWNTLDREDEGLSLAEGEKSELQPRQLARTALPVEYSAKRHREAIEHILHVLEGLNTTLDTPCKLWTFFAVAKLLDVAKVPAVSGYIMSWFYHSTNIRFLEVHPEISYRVSCGIGVGSLCVDSFIGLVGDEALLYIMREASLGPPKPWAPILDRSRIADFLDDTDVQRIEYASKSFADKIIGDFLYLAGTDMPWIAKVDEFAKLNQHLQDFPGDGELVHQLVTLLKDFIRYRIYRVLCTAKDPRRSCNIPPPSEFDSHRNEFDQPAVVQRIIGRHFWRDLLSLDLDSSILFPLDQHHHSIAAIGNGMTAFQGQENACIRPVPRYSVDQKVREFNMALRSQLSQILFHPSRRRALGSKSSHFPKSTVDTSGPFQNSEPSTSTDDGHNKPLTINVRSSQPSEPPQPPPKVVPSSSFDRPLVLANRLRSQPSSAGGQNQIPERASNDLSLNFPSNPTSQTLAVPDLVLESTNAALDAEARSFNVDCFLSDANSRVIQLSQTLLFPHGTNTSALEATDILFSLTDDQYRFLPLWAGGLDDGSGGVFTDQNIPVMEAGGFSAPGPAVHTGSVALTNTDNSLSEIGPDDSQSTVQGASHHATHSHVSDLWSVDSFEGLNRGIHDGTAHMRSPATSVPTTAVVSDEGDNFDIRTDSGSTVVMGSPRLSDIDDDEEIDTDLEHVGIYDDDFELVDSN